MKNQKSRFEILVLATALTGVLAGVHGCDLFEELEGREWRNIHFDIKAHVYSSLSRNPIYGASVYLKAQKYRSESRSSIPGTDLFVERQTYTGGIGEWEFDYKLLYDREERRYMEYVIVSVYVVYTSLSGHSAAAKSGYVRIYPHGGGWSKLKFSEPEGSTEYNRKIVVELPLPVPSLID